MSSLNMFVSIRLENERETIQLGNDLSLMLGVGDCLCLHGDLGVGKSTLARSIIRSLADDDELEVPSPTYTLEQVYDLLFPTHHYDFYRLESADELEELEVFDVLERGVALIEWPQLAADLLPNSKIDITLEAADGDCRIVTISAENSQLKRVKRCLAIRSFLNKNWKEQVVRKQFSGDASSRKYEIVSDGTISKILMDAPRQPDGPAIRNGLPYSQISHLAEDVSAFVAIDKILKEKGYNAPSIDGYDLENGFVLMNHLGSEQIIDNNRSPITERYYASVDTLAAMHSHDWPENIVLEEGASYEIARYDAGVIQIETELLTDWYIPDKTGKACTRQQKEEFEQIWLSLYHIVKDTPQTMVLRDYHSPNIIWNAELPEHQKVGLIDFQDALIGPESYDVASLAQDARVDIPNTLENAIVERYLTARKSQDTNFNSEAFLQSYAIMAAQRATKILGIFVRLHIRDTKPEYRKHIPRMQSYLERSLKHPVLSPYKEWLDRTLHDVR